MRGKSSRGLPGEASPICGDENKFSNSMGFGLVKLNETMLKLIIFSICLLNSVLGEGKKKKINLH